MSGCWLGAGDGGGADERVWRVAGLVCAFEYLIGFAVLLHDETSGVGLAAEVVCEIAFAFVEAAHSRRSCFTRFVTLLLRATFAFICLIVVELLHAEYNMSRLWSGMILALTFGVARAMYYCRFHLSIPVIGPHPAPQLLYTLLDSHADAAVTVPPTVIIST